MPSETVASQLDLVGLEETCRQAELQAPNRIVQSRLIRRIERVHSLLTDVPDGDDLAFLHSGLCQTALPHSRPNSDDAIWQRSAGRFHLLINPGAMRDDATGKAIRVGVPYGTKARLIMIFLQTEGMTSKSRLIKLGDSMSDFLRGLGLTISGGPRGTMTAVKEQCKRIALCSFTLQWSDRMEDGSEGTIITDTRIAKGLELWNTSRDNWSGTVELSREFHEHLREHAVPLSKHGIAHLAGNSFGLDLYALFAYRLRKLNRDLHLSWTQLQMQVGADYADTKALARRVREVMPEVMVAYPEARVDVTRHGLLLKPSKPPVIETKVNGLRLVKE